MMKWLCIDCRVALCTGSCNATLLNGTLPTAASKCPSGSRVSAKDSARTVACGYSSAQIAAVSGSSSTPVICADSGARPMNVPAPEPGSRTAPPLNPSPSSSRHTCRAIIGSV